MSITEILSRLERIEAKLDKLLPEEVKEDVILLTSVRMQISRSGNISWKASSVVGDVVYFRQVQRELLVSGGLWDTLNELELDRDYECNITVYTVPDGDFKKPVRFRPGGTITVEKCDDESELVRVVKSGDFIVLDTETTGLKGEVVQLAIIDSEGNKLLNKLVKPSVPIEGEAASVHGISNELVANAASFAEITPEIINVLTTHKTVIGWNILFDRDALRRSGATNPHLLRVIDATTWIDAMEPFSEIYGEWNEYYGNYKWQKLVTAARYYNINADYAHSALGDCEVTLEVIKKMAES